MWDFCAKGKVGLNIQNTRRNWDIWLKFNINLKKTFHTQIINIIFVIFC